MSRRKGSAPAPAQFAHSQIGGTNLEPTSQIPGTPVRGCSSLLNAASQRVPRELRRQGCGREVRASGDRRLGFSLLLPSRRGRGGHWTLCPRVLVWPSFSSGGRAWSPDPSLSNPPPRARESRPSNFASPL